jgi:hypothetical protein
VIHNTICFIDYEMNHPVLQYLHLTDYPHTFILQNKLPETISLKDSPLFCVCVGGGGVSSVRQYPAPLTCNPNFKEISASIHC